MKCAVCGQKKGKRPCLGHDGAAVCSQCCAAIRTADDCEGCPHFAQAEEYRKERVRHGARPRDFVMRVDEQVEDETDQALHLIAGGQQSEGEARVRQLYEDNPDLACTQYAMGVVYLTKDEPEQAIPYFEQAVETFPYFAEAHYNLSACYGTTLQLTKAIRSLQQARDLAPVDGAVHTQAQARLREFAESIPGTEGVDLDAFLEAGDAFDRGFEAMNAGDTRQAVTEFQECLRLNPTTHQAYGNLGICYGKLGMRDKAAAMLDKALEINPDYELARWNRESLDRLADGEDLPTASIEYGAARFLEEEERAGRRADGERGSEAGLLKALRRRFSRR